MGLARAWPVEGVRYMCLAVTWEMSWEGNEWLSVPTDQGEASDTRPLAPSGYPGFQATTYASRSYTGLAPGYTYQFPGESCSVSLLPACPRLPGSLTPQGGVWGCMAGAGGLPAGCLEGRACLRKEHLSPPTPSSPIPRSWGWEHQRGPAWQLPPRPASCLLPLPPPPQVCHFHQRGHRAVSVDTRIVPRAPLSPPRPAGPCETPDAEKQLKSVVTTTLICDAK